MRFAHLADLHLGFKFGYRVTADGQNQREADVATAFRNAVDAVIAAKPDAVGFAGDLFHQPKPSNATIVFAFQQFSRLRQGLPGVPIVAVAGNHDASRTNDAGSILRLFAELGIDLAIDGTRRFSYPALDLQITAVPDAALRNGDRSGLVPVGSERYKVLLIHGEVAGLYGDARGDRPGAEVSPEEIAVEGWNFTALGDYHVQHQVGPRAWYSGSIEYTSSNIWGEVKTEGAPGKGWLLADLDTGAVTRQPLPLARTIHDLPPIEAEGLTAEEVDAQVAQRVASVPGGIRDAFCRLKVLNLPRALHRDLNHAAIKRWKAEAFHFLLDIRKPEMVKTAVGRALRQRERLDVMLARFLGDRPLTPGIDRGRLINLGAEALAAVDRDYGGAAAAADETRGVA